MKIIFLDIDGVLNDTSTCGESYVYNKLDADKVAILNEILSQTEAAIVISSAWRIGREVQRLKEIFSDNKVAGLIIGMTSENGNNRADEIRQWLAKHPDVKEFVIIDDDDFDLEEFRECRTVLVNAETGLQEKHIQEAVTKISGAK